jgi:hypothetical protein
MVIQKRTSAPPTIDPRQKQTLMVRAAASSPSDTSHLGRLSIEAEHPTDGEHANGIYFRKLGPNPTINESDENTRTLIQQQKLTASKDHTPHCCLRTTCYFSNKRLKASNRV